MAKSIELTKNITIVDGGVTVVDRQWTSEAEIEEMVEGTIRVNNGGDKFVCVAGSEGAEVSPMSLGLTTIRGLALDCDVQVEVRLDGAAAGFMAGPGAFLLDNTTLETIKLLNGSGLPANIKYVIWGDR